MKRISCIMSFVLIWIGSDFLLSQEIIPGNRIDPSIGVDVKFVGNMYRFDFTLLNAQSAEQNTVEFTLITSANVQVSDQGAPVSWEVVILYGQDLRIRWFARANDEVEGYKNPLTPGKKLGGFSFRTSSIPGVVAYYAEGDHPIPHFPQGMAIDSIPGYSDLTPYGPGVIGKTVGPVLSPEPFMAASFLDTLVSYKHQALALKWIDNEGIANSLDQKLENARQRLQSGDSVAARNILNAFVNDVEAQKDKHLTSEAYALLKYNAEYLINRLPQKK